MFRRDNDPNFGVSKQALLSGFGWGTAWLLSGVLGLMLVRTGDFASPFSPAAGVALAAALAGGGYRLIWIAAASTLLFCGARAVGGLAWDGIALVGAVSVACAAVLQAWLGGRALKPLVGHPATFDRAGDVIRFLLAAPVIALTGASLSVASLLSQGLLSPEVGWASWLTWWIGDALGIMVVLPLALVAIGEPRDLWRRRRLNYALPVIIATLAFITVFVQSRKWEFDESLSQFRLLSRQLADGMQNHFSAQEGLLEQMEGLIEGREALTREAFHRVAGKALERMPLMHAVAWAPLVTGPERAGFEADQQREQRGFRILQKAPGGQDTETAAARPNYYPVTYVEPEMGNEAALGLDLASSTERRMAVETSLSRHVAVATAPLSLVQAQGKHAGVLLVQAVPDASGRNNLVLTVIRTDDLMTRLLSFADGMLFVRLIDDDAGRRIHDSFDRPNTEVAYERGFRFGTRNYILQTAPSPAYWDQYRRWDSWIVLAAGMTGVSLLSGLLLLATGYTARVESEVRERTRALAESEARLAEITSTLGEGVIVLDESGRIQFSNQEARRLLGWNEAELAELHPRPLFHPPEDVEPCSPAEACVLKRVRESGEIWRFEDEIFWRRDGEPLNVAGCYSPFLRDGRFAGVVAAFSDVSQRKKAEEARRASEARVRSILERAPIGMALVSICGQFVEVNQALCDILGYGRQDLQRLTFMELVHGEDLGPILGCLERLLLGNSEVEAMEQRYVRRDGSVVWAMLTVSLLSDREGKAQELIAQVQDITERKRQEAELLLAASVFHNTMDGVMVTDRDCRIVSVNPAFTRITGYGAEEAIGRTPGLLRSDHHDPAFYSAMWDALQRDGRWEGEVWNRRKDGEVFLEWLTIGMVPGGDGRPERYVGVFNDITELRRKDEHIRHQAFHDALTGLPNRTLLLDRLRQRTAFALRDDDRFGVMFIDLDRFKAINDSLGHDVGDGLLREVAQRLTQCVRSSDTVARMGGDEFVVLLDSGGNLEDFAGLAHAIIERLSEPISVAGYSLRIGASVGIACCPDDGTDAVALMKHADAAMYAAKAGSRGSFRFFQSAMTAKAAQRLNMEMELRNAVTNGELELFYQPKVSLWTGRIEGLEALVRWRHPSMGLVPPGEFIPLAEETGIIHALGDWVLAEACRQVAAWGTEGLGTIRVAVNLAAGQLQQGDLAARIIGLTEEHRIPPSALQLELTESSVMANPEHVAGVFTRLREIGVTVAVDDFGTGYSSLAYLRRLPIDVLKIDRSFVMNADRDEGDAQIVRTILALGQALKLDVVAEGVETEGQAEFLKSCGCTTGQGYYYAKPASATEIGAWLGGRMMAAGESGRP